MTPTAPLDSRRFHHPRRHAAVRTDEYLYAQLIPYLGNKRKLLPLICRGLTHTGLVPAQKRPPRLGSPAAPLFVDLFSGSTVVSRLAKTLGFAVLANDWEPYAYELALGTVALSRVPAFAALGGAERAFADLNALGGEDGYVATHLCPADDERADPLRERMFFTRANGRRIDAIRGRIAAWESAGRLDAGERAYLLAALLYATSYASNTSGVFKGFHHGWGGRTATALGRIRGRLTLRPPVLFDNGLGHAASRADAQALAERFASGGDTGTVLEERRDAGMVFYLDPPYNQHPYGSNYHVLNTVALGDRPPAPVGVMSLPGGSPRRGDKSAIRRDWRTLRRSAFNAARTAPAALRALLAALDAASTPRTDAGPPRPRWLLLSYSTDGNIPIRDVLNALAEHGELAVYGQRYKRYRVSAPRRSPRSANVEFLAVVELGTPPSVSRVERIARRIEGAEAECPPAAIRSRTGDERQGEAADEGADQAEF